MRRLPIFLLFLMLASTRAFAQNPANGIRLELTYKARYRPPLAVLPVTDRGGAGHAAETIRDVIRTDLDFSDRFDIVEAEAADYKALGARGVLWAIAAEVSRGPSGIDLRVKLHDVTYGRAKETYLFRLPAAENTNFRQLVHGVSDEIVRWITGQRGMAASRVLFVARTSAGSEVWSVDSDGFNLKKITNDGSIVLSPAWSPDGERIAYTTYKTGSVAIALRSLWNGEEQILTNSEGINITPAFSPDGRTLAFGATRNGNTEVTTIDLARGCCVRVLTLSRRSDSLQPTFSPDGRSFAYVSSRIGQPQIYVQDLGSGRSRMVSRYAYGSAGYNQAPDWSPTDSRIVYHTRVGGGYHIMLVNADGTGSRQLTASGVNEDPSWAPDGRHIVFAGVRDGVRGLFVMDIEGGRVRTLTLGDHSGPDWSRRLVDVSAPNSK